MEFETNVVINFKGHEYVNQNLKHRLGAVVEYDGVDAIDVTAHLETVANEERRELEPEELLEEAFLFLQDKDVSVKETFYKREEDVLRFTEDDLSS